MKRVSYYSGRMNKLIVFPGNSPRNKAWGECAAQHFGGWFDAVYTPDYDHWATGESFINFDAELDKLRANILKDEPDTQYYVFAKSIGTILTVIAVKRGIIAPQKCVFFGMPLKIVEEQETFGDDWSALSSFTVPTLAFHSDRDPTADYAFTVAKLTELNPAITLITTPGDTHDYTEFVSYEVEIRNFLAL